MKVEMEIVKRPGYSTKAIKTLMVDERWVDRIEKISKGKIRRVPLGNEEVPAGAVEVIAEATEAPRRRRRKTEE